MSEETNLLDEGIVRYFGIARERLINATPRAGPRLSQRVHATLNPSELVKRNSALT